MKIMSEKYIFYKRKSSDSEDKQILSLDSQDRIIRESIPNFNSFNITADYQESMSAKAPGRPKFNHMCEKLESGEAQYIICWQLNRLARNPVDGGRIIWLVQNFGVKIITHAKTYDVNDILLMYVEFAMSNQFINDLKKNSARGVEDKLRAGNAPILAPLGYLNDITKKQGLRDILADPKTFDLVRKMWDLLLTGHYSPQRIWFIATNEWGLRHREGKPFSRSKIYELFTNIFYTGKHYIYAGVTYDNGVHQPMISLDEYDRAQKILGRRGKPRMLGHQFSYTKLIKCVCGSGITAHERFRKVCSECHYKYNAQKNEICPKCKTEAPENTWYKCYYHCSKKYDSTCKQPYVDEESLYKQFDHILSTLTIPQDFVNWTIQRLREQHQQEIQNSTSINNHLQVSLNAVTSRLNNLLTKYLGDDNKSGELISDTEYKQQKNLLQEDRKRLEKELQGMGVNQDNWLDTAEKVFNFAVHARYWLEKGTLEERRTIAAAFGLNLTLDNRLLRYDLLKPFERIKEAADIMKDDAKKVSPQKRTVIAGESYYLDQQNPLWGD